MTLSELLTRLRWLLSDPEGELWLDDVLQESLRLALAEIQQICPLLLQVAGLEGAQTTSLDGMQDLLLRRARCLAIRQRLQIRYESYHPDQPHKDSWETLLKMEQQTLDEALNRRRLMYLQRSVLAPYACWPDKVNENDG